MDVTKWGAAEWAAAGSIGAVVVYIVLGVIALRQLGESRRLRQLQTRPYVLVDFYFKGLWVMLEVSNIGTTPARNVEVTFDKPLQSADKRDANFTILDAPIPMMAPGRTIRLPMGQGPAFFKEGANLPLSYSVRIKYTDATGKQKYSDPMLLDLEPYQHTVPPRDNAGDLVAAVRDVRNTLNKWNSSSGLKVVATDRLKYDRSQRHWNHFYEVRELIREGGGVRRIGQFEIERLKRRFR